MTLPSATKVISMSERDIPIVNKAASGAVEAGANAANSGIGKFVQSINDAKNGANSAPPAGKDSSATPAQANDAAIAGILSGAAAGAKAALDALTKDALPTKNPPGIPKDGSVPNDTNPSTGDKSKIQDRLDQLRKEGSDKDQLPPRPPVDVPLPGQMEKQKPSDHLNQIEKFFNDNETFDAKKEGITKLHTGDRLVRTAGGSEVLIAPNGGVVTVNKDGSIDVDSKEPVKISTKDKTTTLTYPNGDTVEVNNGAISRVQRGDKVSESSANNHKWNKWDSPNLRPRDEIQPDARPKHRGPDAPPDSHPNPSEKNSIPPEFKKYLDLAPLDMSVPKSSPKK